MAMASAPACAVSELVAKGKESAIALRAVLGQQSLGGGERATKQVEKKWTMEDGFLWRKYGQKDIHGSKYPRLYFRCSYKEDHGCMARRQVQQSEDDPSVYLINYFGEHTCCRDNGVSEDPESSPEPFVINFGASTMDDGKPSGSSPAWPSSDDDGPVVSEISSDLCHSPAEEKELGAGMGNNAAELFEQSTPPAPELTTSMSMSSPEWDDPSQGCLVWDMGLGESLFDDIGEFDHLDYYVRLFQ
ncbi:hypothetical protein HU200_031826 [Digitaria exilis]|uniref:WRKY domain-containing protein n=1 Tax=Digitaria exilis TaxID=1010633 RepID=A0A835EPE9_9POAL|nr:hypothetical protein HU200_031826 [Digitaria exilis]